MQFLVEEREREDLGLEALKETEAIRLSGLISHRYITNTYGNDYRNDDEPRRLSPS